MADDRTPLDQVLDLFVFGPLGVALTVRDELPKLVQKGRERWSTQSTVARVVGEFAVREGQRRAEELGRQVAERLSPAPAAPTGPAPAPPVAASPPAAAPAPPAEGNGAVRPRLDAGHLAIPGYDSLSASQVVQRLAGLTGEELAAVREYESATRARRTVLSRIAQLQA